MEGPIDVSWVSCGDAKKAGSYSQNLGFIDVKGIFGIVLLGLLSDLLMETIPKTMPKDVVLGSIAYKNCQVCHFTFGK